MTQLIYSEIRNAIMYVSGAIFQRTMSVNPWAPTSVLPLYTIILNLMPVGVSLGLETGKTASYLQGPWARGSHDQYRTLMSVLWTIQPFWISLWETIWVLVCTCTFVWETPSNESWLHLRWNVLLWTAMRRCSSLDLPMAISRLIPSKKVLLILTCPRCGIWPLSERYSPTLRSIQGMGSSKTSAKEWLRFDLVKSWISNTFVNLGQPGWWYPLLLWSWWKHENEEVAREGCLCQCQRLLSPIIKDNFPCCFWIFPANSQFSILH